MIIATAGHVDHGKTTLLEALTGVNADRLPEEKKRGMTIDLGYAYWPQPDGRVIGFIDVPGHEKFLANMLAGVGGIDSALLVVACDDGIMPQTQEHLAILALTGRPALTIALTKADCVSEARVAQVSNEVIQTVQACGWSDAALFVTAAARGQGIQALSAHLQALPERAHPADKRFRLAIDRAFSIKGAGLVVTGTALSGEVNVGDTLWLTGADKPMRVRGLHAQNQPVAQAQAGQRIALNITGDVQKADVQRGDWLLAARPPAPSTRIIVQLENHGPLQQWQPLHIHHAARHITGRVSLLENDLAELVFDTPLWVVHEDRLILRDISARHTLGGARVLLLDPPHRGKRRRPFLDWLAQLCLIHGDEEAFNGWLPRGSVSLSAFAWARQLTPPGLEKYLQHEALLRAGDDVLSATVAAHWQQRLLDTLARYHAQHDDQPGLGRERLRRMALPMENEGLVLVLIDRLRQEGQLASREGWLHLPEHRPRFSDEQQALWLRVDALLGSDPWWVRTLADETGHDEQMMRQFLNLAARQGLITAIVKDRYYRRERIIEFATLIRTLDKERGATCAADFRDRLGVGRKLAVQILEYFNRVGFTRRRGNEHVLRDDRLFSAD